MAENSANTPAGTPAEQDRGVRKLDAGSGCCPPAEQASCCGPAEKASCCGTAASGTCGCQSGGAASV